MSFDTQESRDLSNIRDTLAQVLDELKIISRLMQDAQATEYSVGELMVREVKLGSKEVE
jgi:hypothetical protein